MVAATIEGVATRGLVSCVPTRREGVEELAARFGGDAARRIADATGIRARRLAGPDECVSDMADAAARRLLAALDWPADSIDLLMVVTQTGDHALPGVASLLHHRLGLDRRVAAMDVGLGCSGYVYGLWMVATMLKGCRDGRRALLVVGDATTRMVDPDDRAVAPLFGDAVSVTALEADPAAPPMTFVLGSDGAGAPYLMARGGGLRHPDEPPRLFMDGTQVFAFTLREVPANVAATLAAAGIDIGDVDLVVPHQANRQMLDRLGRKIGAAPERMVAAMAEYGNTSSASIPLAITSALAETLSASRRRLLLSGFGVGWSWGSAVVSMGPLAACETMPLGPERGVC